jgi:hypothetical protein
MGFNDRQAALAGKRRLVKGIQVGKKWRRG